MIFLKIVINGTDVGKNKNSGLGEKIVINWPATGALNIYIFLYIIMVISILEFTEEVSKVLIIYFSIS